MLVVRGRSAFRFVLRPVSCRRAVDRLLSCRRAVDRLLSCRRAVDRRDAAAQRLVFPRLCLAARRSVVLRPGPVATAQVVVVVIVACTGQAVAGVQPVLEAGHRDPVRPPCLHARLDRRTDVVDVDVDVPGRRRALTGAHHHQRVAEGVQRHLQRLDRLGMRVQQVLHLVAVLRLLDLELDRHHDRLDPRRGAAGQGLDQRIQQQAEAAAAGVDHAGPGQHRKLVRSAGQRLGGRSRGGPGHHDQIVRLDLASRIGRGGHDGQHGALDRVGDRGIRRLAGRAQRAGQLTAPHRDRGGEGVGHPAQDLGHDDTRVAPGAEQRPTSHPAHRPAQRRLRAVPLAVDLALEGLGGRRQGQDEVGAGVTVGHRIDVQLVDLVLVCTQRSQPTTAPAVDRSVVQGVQHAKIVLTSTDILPRKDPDRGDWLSRWAIG